MTNGYGELDAYGTYGNGELTPYELLLRMKSWNKAIYLTIENNDAQLKTQLAVLDGEIRQNVLDVKEGLETTISTTAAGLQANITNSAQGLQTQITANANGIATKVSQTDYNGNKVASLIAQTPAAISLIAQSLNLSGYVTFSSLTAGGTTQIDGARITTGLISADRIQAQTVLAKLIQAGGISADQITSGTINANRLNANAITTTLVNAGGINASIITGGTISGDRINGGTISGVTLSGVYLYTDQMASVGTTLNIGQNAFGSKNIRFGDGYEGISAFNGTVDIYGSTVTANGNEIATTRTGGLGFGYSSANGRLYVSINGSDVGFVALT